MRRNSHRSGQSGLISKAPACFALCLLGVAVVYFAYGSLGESETRLTRTADELQHTQSLLETQVKSGCIWGDMGRSGGGGPCRTKPLRSIASLLMQTYIQASFYAHARTHACAYAYKHVPIHMATNESICMPWHMPIRMPTRMSVHTAARMSSTKGCCTNRSINEKIVAVNRSNAFYVSSGAQQ